MKPFPTLLLQDFVLYLETTQLDKSWLMVWQIIKTKRSFNTPDIFWNGSIRLSELVVQGSSYFFKVSSASDLKKKILSTAELGFELRTCSNFVRSVG